jgi:hypothetical protein
MLGISTLNHDGSIGLRPVRTIHFVSSSPFTAMLFVPSPLSSICALNFPAAKSCCNSSIVRHELSRRVQFTNSDRVFFNQAALILNRIRKSSRETHGKRPRI